MKKKLNTLTFKYVLILAVSVVATMSWQLHLIAQDNERDNAEEIDTLKRLDPELLNTHHSKQLSFGEGDLLWDWGLFTRQYFVNFEDGSGHYLANRYESYRAWARFSYADTLGSYIRLKTSRRVTRRGDHRGGNHSKRENVTLDVGYLSYKYSQPGQNYVLQAGRYFVSHGSGIALLKRLDGARLNFGVGPVRGFIHRGRSVSSEHNQNPVAPNSHTSKRQFIGAEVEYTTLGQWRPYLSFVKEWDTSDEKPNNLSQNFHTDFNFYIAGIRGELTPRWKLSGEYIWQNGRVPIFGSPRHRQGQHSNAFMISSQYIWSPEAILEYNFIYARGDNDKNSVTAVGNNADSNIGGSDNNFYYFGYANTGLVYAPRISNMVINHVAITLPLPSYNQWQLRFDAFNFRRDVSHSPNSDPFTTRNRADLGREVNAAVEFRPYSNMSILGRYGAFFEGKSYRTDAGYSRRRNHSVREYWNIAWSLDF